jgi:carbonic anhydrase
MIKIYMIALVLGLSNCASIEKREIISSTKTQEQQQELSPWQALQKLKRGNERFLTNTQRERDLIAQVASSEKQFPFAVVLGCMDSRGSPEMIFDQGIGDIFTERLAGNVINADVLGGMEFGTKLSGAKLIIVLGHSSCGAVKGACDNAKLGNLTHLLDKIKPAVNQLRKKDKNLSCENAQNINQIATNNIKNVIKQIKKESPVINSLIQAGEVGLVGAMHDLATGKVEFFEEKALLPGAP